MGFKYENQHFFNKCLPMGASISCSLLENFLSSSTLAGLFSKIQILTIFYIIFVICYLVGKLKPNNPPIFRILFKNLVNYGSTFIR